MSLKDDLKQEFDYNFLWLGKKSWIYQYILEEYFFITWWLPNKY